MADWRDEYFLMRMKTKESVSNFKVMKLGNVIPGLLIQNNVITNVTSTNMPFGEDFVWESNHNTLTLARITNCDCKKKDLVAEIARFNIIEVNESTDIGTLITSLFSKIEELEKIAKDHAVCMKTEKEELIANKYNKNGIMWVPFKAEEPKILLIEAMDCNNRLYLADIRSTEETRYRVHFHGYGSHHDEWVAKERTYPVGTHRIRYEAHGTTEYWRV